MQKPELQKPTVAELAILRILWDRGQSTVAEVKDVLSQRKAKGALKYTAVLKALQTMADKGLVDRQERGRAHVYRARIKQPQAQRSYRDLVFNLFRDSIGDLIAAAIDSNRLSRAQLDEIAEQIEKLRRREQSGKKSP
ncbi:MAG: BlaI/MecI/CopY family transcriptional regulator [Planctomycetia bacterium]|nr:BlaI/MecI/CopY family transcriptional regulator [Planctomycetia bacterium]